MITTLTHVFVRFIPKEVEEGILYVSMDFQTAIHLCACGCGQKTVMPFNEEGGWKMENVNGLLSFTPSIGNFSGENPYHAHYYIVNNEIKWCDPPTKPTI